MKARVNPDGTRTFYINNTETPPTGTVEGNIDVETGDVCVNADTKEVKMFNGTSWVDWS